MNNAISKAEVIKRGLFQTREMTADNTVAIDGRLAEREPASPGTTPTRATVAKIGRAAVVEIKCRHATGNGGLFALYYR